MNISNHLGHVFESIDVEVYPMVGLCTAGEAIRANFGHQPFRYDIESHVHLQRNTTWLKIQSTPMTWSPSELTFQPLDTATSGVEEEGTKARETDTREAMEKIVMDYLSHHGYAQAAEAFRLSIAARSSNTAALASSTNSSSDSKVLALSSSADILSRQRITTALLSGDIDYVLETMSDRYPEALAADGGWLLFRLRCRKFVELVLEAAAALKIARKVEVAEAASRDKGKGPSVVTPPPTASLPIRKALAHTRPSYVFEEEEEDDDDDREDSNAMDIDENDEEDAADHRAVQEHLLQTPSSSPIPSSHFSSPRRVEKTAPMAIFRPLIPISTASSSPDSTPPNASPIAVAPLSILSPISDVGSNGSSNRAASNGATGVALTTSTLSSNLATNAPPKVTSAPLFAEIPSPPKPRGLITAPPRSSSAQAALEHIFAYGRQLDADYGADERAHVQMLFHRTSSLVAYENPLEAGGDVSRLAGQEAREELAVAVNEGILGTFASSLIVVPF